jgi:Leucine-rich repeat (LRR) protein
LQRNDFSGTIDPSFGDLKIIELWLHGNPVTGTIPSELGKLSNYLLDLRLYNTKLHGEIPAEIWGLTKLWRLELHETLEFSGTISRDIGNLQSLSIFKIHDNKFTGTVPTELASLPNLHTVTLGGNQFFGSVPSGLCELKGEDGLSFLEADCLPHPDSTSTQIFCECCDSCCNAAFEECSGGSDEH